MGNNARVQFSRFAIPGIAKFLQQVSYIQNVKPSVIVLYIYLDFRNIILISRTVKIE